MRFNKTFLRSYAVYANDLDAFIPEFWANESLAVLEENLVASGLVYRNFENTLAQHGDTVNCRRPNRFEPVRKDLTDNVTVQDATAVNVPVKLDQHVHTSFMIRDGEESKSMKQLVDEYIVPAVKGMARWTDRMVLGQYGQFIVNATGKLNMLDSTNAKSYLIDSRKKTQSLLWPDGDPIRPFIMNEDVEAQMLNTDLFVSAEKVGDQGSALRTASLGRKFGYDMLMSQQMGNIPSGNTVKDGLINNAAGYPAGTTQFTVDTFTGDDVAVGEFVTISDSTSVFGGWVSRVTAKSLTLGATTSITILDAIPFATVDNAKVRCYKAGAVNNGPGYAIGWSKAIVVSGFTVAPKVGQMVTFTNGVPTAADPVYTVLGTDVTTTSITLDRPLEIAIANAAAVNIGAAGDYSFSFLRDAIALVIRPLAAPQAGTGARSAVVNYNNLSMRATITYDGNKQGHLVTLDFLAGIKVLNKNFGTVMLG
jgi:hypothetical protein